MADAPEIDGAGLPERRNEGQTGDVVRVKVEHADEYDLWGSGLNPAPLIPDCGANAPDPGYKTALIRTIVAPG